MRSSAAQNTIVAGICVALNIGLGKVANILSLPITMDTVGTILSAALLPWPLTLFVGGASSVIASVVIHPAFMFYIGTQLVIAAAAILLFRSGAFSVLWKSAIAGAMIGVLSAAASSPVTVVVFGGVSVPSITALNAVFLAAGETLWQSVIRGALIVESLDKVAASIVVWYILRRAIAPQVK